MIQNLVKGIVVGGVVAGFGLGVISEMAPRSASAPLKGAAAEQIAATEAPVTPNATPKPIEPAKPAPVAKPVAAAPAKPNVTAPNPATVTPKAETTVPAPASGPPLVSIEEPAARDVQIEGTAPEVKPFADPAALPAAPNALPKASTGDALPLADARPAAPLRQVDLPQTPGVAPIANPPAPPPAESLLTPAPEINAPAPGQIVMDPPLTVEKPKVLAPPAPAVIPPAQGLPKSTDGVKTGRLPSIGTAPEVTEEPVAPSVTDDTPLTKFARSFTNDTSKPLFVVVLQDNGAADLDRAALAALPFAVTFVIDPLDPTAADAEQIYRAAGQEVVMLASGIPKAATASDLEQSFQANAAVLPQAVAVMDIGAGGFQDDRPLAALVVPLIASQGRGLLTFDKGLNAADQVARRDGLPAATIFRALDVEGEDAPLIRRYLDRAAFKAAQEGRVVVLGSTRPEMISALMEWAVEGRGASVALAPLTAVLTK